MGTFLIYHVDDAVFFLYFHFHTQRMSSSRSTTASVRFSNMTSKLFQFWILLRMEKLISRGQWVGVGGTQSTLLEACTQLRIKHSEFHNISEEMSGNHWYSMNNLRLISCQVCNIQVWHFNKKTTRMHSSRKRTARLLTVSRRPTSRGFCIQRVWI